VLDASRAGARRLPGSSPPALIEQNELAIGRHRRESRPQHLMAEMETSIDAEKWRTALHGRAHVYREVQSSRFYCAP
jgi:hypothetical protein